MPDTTDEGKIHFLSPQLLKKLDYQTPISKFFAKATYMSRRTEPESLDFSFGDPYEMPPPGFVEALQRWSVPPLFVRDLYKQVHVARINEDIESGLQSGVTAAPALFINAIQYSGRWNIEQLKAAIVAASH